MRKPWLYYCLLIVLGLTAAVLCLLQGAAQFADVAGTAVVAANAPQVEWTARLELAHSKLLLQIIAVVLAAKLVATVAQRLGQPAVIGEMVAGLLLGPSLLGLVAPGLHGWLFAPASLQVLESLSLLGVVIFLFGVGAELDLRQLRHHGARLLLISHSSIALPFVLGLLLSLWLYREYAPAGVGFTPFALFMGIAMSITAFPVLARILRERRLVGTPLGETAMACAATADVSAWCLLVLVIGAGQPQGAATALPTLAGTVLFCALLLFGLRPRLSRLADRAHAASSRIVGLLLFALSCAWATEVIGVHALFGAFLAGVAVSGQRQLRELVTDRIEPLAGALLLPLFFAFTGLRTQLGLLQGSDWLVCAGIIALATLGKLGGAALPARLAGQSWRDALALGALMNTRGLMELVVLNVGYDLGFISDRIFAMMVLMALATTLMTTPLLKLIQRRAAVAQLPVSA